LRNRVAQFSRAVESVDLLANIVASGQIAFRRGAEIVVDKTLSQRLSLKDGYQPAGSETEPHVEAE
jgi:hypothetical protein